MSTRLRVELGEHRVERVLQHPGVAAARAAPASSSRSKSSTFAPASARNAAAAQPTIPPPMTATSGRVGLSPARVVDDRLVDQPLDGRLVVGVDLAAAQRLLEPPSRPPRAVRPEARRQRRDGRRAGARRTAAASLATISVLVGSIGSRSTCGKTSPIVAVSTFSSSSWPSGWPALTISTPPGREAVAHRLEELHGGQVERDVGLAVGVDRDDVVARVGPAQERAARPRGRGAGAGCSCRSTRARCRTARGRSPRRPPACSGKKYS